MYIRRENDTYTLYGAEVKKLKATSAIVTYLVIETKQVCRIGMNKWRENAKKVEAK